MNRDEGQYFSLMILMRFCSFVKQQVKEELSSAVCTRMYFCLSMTWSIGCMICACMNCTL